MDKVMKFREWLQLEKLEDGYSNLGILDVALALSKICRYAGKCRTFWPVLLHSMAVAELVPVNVVIHALLHDAGEIFIGDVPVPFKPECLKEIEDQALEFVYEQLGVRLPSIEQREIVKAAEAKILVGEVWTVGPRPLREHPLFEHRDREAEELIAGYLVNYTFHQILSPTGIYVQRFVATFYRSLSIA